VLRERQRIHPDRVMNRGMPILTVGIPGITGLIRRDTVSQTSIDDFGPVDYLVVEFPSETSHFNGEMAMELASLVEAELIQILDLVLLRKNDDGSVEALEIDDLDQVDELRKVETQIAEILAADDIANLAEAMEPGSTAGVLVWENSWAAPFASAARRAGGQLIAGGRIPIQAIVASLEAETEGV
jgi:hypothetical protein